MVRGYILIHTLSILLFCNCFSNQTGKDPVSVTKIYQMHQVLSSSCTFQQYHCYFNSRYFLAVMEDRNDGCIVQRELFYLDIFLCCWLSSSDNVQLRI